MKKPRAGQERGLPRPRHQNLSAIQSVRDGEMEARGLSWREKLEVLRKGTGQGGREVSVLRAMERERRGNFKCE